jgi:hypothetical protein
VPSSSSGARYQSGFDEPRSCILSRLTRDASLAVGRFGRGEGIPPSALVGALPCAGPPGAQTIGTRGLGSWWPNQPRPVTLSILDQNRQPIVAWNSRSQIVVTTVPPVINQSMRLKCMQHITYKPHRCCKELLKDADSGGVLHYCPI